MQLHLIDSQPFLIKSGLDSHSVQTTFSYTVIFSHAASIKFRRKQMQQKNFQFFFEIFFFHKAMDSGSEF